MCLILQGLTQHLKHFLSHVGIQMLDFASEILLNIVSISNLKYILNFYNYKSNYRNLYRNFQNNTKKRGP